jgi:hypothetical protein
MRLRNLSISVATILSLTAAPASAGPKSAPAKGAAPKTATAHGSPKTTTTTSSPKTTMTTTHGSPKTTSGSQKTTSGSPKTTSGSPKTTSGSPKTTSGSPKKASTTTTTSAANHGQAKKSPAPTTSSTTTASTTTPTTNTTLLNPIAEKITSKQGLNSKVGSLLPQGMSLNEASKGFKNQGQFIAALHVSQNLGIPFADLKTAMTGIRPITLPPSGGTTIGGTTTGGTTTGGTTTVTTTTESTPLLSLGQAIKKLRPTANADAAETRATTQATTDLGGR